MAKFYLFILYSFVCSIVSIFGQVLINEFQPSPKGLDSTNFTLPPNNISTIDNDEKNNNDSYFLYSAGIEKSDYSFTKVKSKLMLEEVASNTSIAINDSLTNTEFHNSNATVNEYSSPNFTMPVEYTTGSINSETKFSLFPNPTNKGYVYVRALHPSGDIFVTVFDMLGKEVINTTLTDSRRLKLSDLKCGIYVIRISNHNSSTTKKLIIN